MDQWLDQIQIESAVVSAAFQRYTTWVIDHAKHMYEQFLTSPGLSLQVPLMEPAAENPMEPRLAVLLARAVPEQVSHESRAMIKGNGTLMGFYSPPFRSLSLLMAVFEFASPGGMEERKGLQNYMRRPGIAKTAEEAINMIRTWKTARGRAMGMGLPDVGDLEMRDGLVGIVKELEAKNDDLHFRIRNLMATPEAKRQTP